MRKSILLIICLGFLSACGNRDYRMEAIGRIGTIMVVGADTPEWQASIGQAVQRELGQEIFTFPAPEPMFDLDFVQITSPDVLDRIKRQKNLIFAAPINGDSRTAEFLRASLDSSVVEGVMTGVYDIFQRDNLWYRDQRVIFATAPTFEDVAETIRINGETLRYRFNEVSRERQTRDMFRKKRQTNLETQTLEKHHFAVNVQHDYIVAQDTTQFVRFRRILSDTWRDLFIHYIEDADPALITPEWITATRDSLAQRYLQGTFEDSYVATAQNRPLTTENINFLDRYGYETRGLWHMVNDAMGGPFVNYTFYDETQRRIYMIDGMIFAPEYKKREFVRQMESIAYTFRTAQNASANDVAQN